MLKNFAFFPVIFLLAFILNPHQAQAQMFSIGDPEPREERSLGQFTIVGIGLEFADFSFSGDAPANQELVNFNNSVLRLRLDSPGLNISFGIGGTITGMENISYLNINGRLFSNIGIIRDDNFHLNIPFQLTTDLKSVQGDNTNNDFQQSSLTIGAGINSIIKLNNRFQLKASATPNYGFSFSQGALFGGSLFRLDGNSTLIINNIFGRNALSIGYHFDYRSYRIDEGFNDYDYTSHLITVGIGF